MQKGRGERPFFFVSFILKSVARLIVNADDLGLTRGVNRAILQAHREGIVTSATLMANSAAVEEAVALAQESQLSVGCHIVLVDGRPLSAPDTIRTLLDGDGFRKKLWKLAYASVAGSISVHEVEQEAALQIRALQKAGVQVSHVDCHKHAHMFPSVLEGVLRAAKLTGVPYIRNPFEPRFARKAAKDPKRSAETALLHWRYAETFRESVAAAGLRTTNGSVGVTATGTLNDTTFAAIVRALPAEGTFEFVCHPGYNDADLAKASTRLRKSRELELATLCSPEAREVLQSANVELTNYRKLYAEGESKPAVSHPMP
jgi:hopanoid biosynthesis associated protein HpnK